VKSLIFALILLLASSSAIGVTIARFQYDGGDWYCDPGSLDNWLVELENRTDIKVERPPVVVKIDSEDLYQYPFLYMSGHGKIIFSEQDKDQLRRYLDAGGFLYVDDNYGLDGSFRELMISIFPDTPLEILPNDHELFHCWYDLPGLPKIHEHDGNPATAYGIIKDKRLQVLYSWSSDIGDGLEDPLTHNDPPEVRELAIRMAVNIMVYAMTHP
jgi:hypothetical protein